jgi:ABC-type Fe3+ transport system permease subunit
MANVCRPRPRWFVYLPLVGHAAPTIIIGYGFVIPQSCIAGLNAQTIGFAIAIVGFVAAYVAGVRIARRQGVRPHA